MKPILKAKCILLIFCFILIVCGSKSDNSSFKTNFLKTSSCDLPISFDQYYSCDINTALTIGIFYVLSCPSLRTNEPTIYSAVNENSQFLDENGTVIQCMRRLGELMVNQGYQNFNFNNTAQNQVHENVLEMANSTGLSAQAGNIADNVVNGMRNQQLQPIIVGNELIWLSNVLPDAANGNWEAYENTGSIFRQQALQQVAYIKLILEMSGLSDQEAAEIVERAMLISLQWSEKYGLGYILGCGISLGVFN